MPLMLIGARQTGKTYILDDFCKNKSPLKAYADEQKIKLYLSDIGLLRSLANISYSEILLNKNETFKGVILQISFFLSLRNYITIVFRSMKLIF